MTTSIYIAGGSSERESCAAMIVKAREAGFLVAHNWTDSPGYHRTLERAEWVEQAALDLRGIRNAEFVWAMLPADRSEGMAFELGYAHASGKRIIVSGPARPLDPFHYLFPERCFALHQSALDWLILEVSRHGY